MSLLFCGCQQKLEGPYTKDVFRTHGTVSSFVGAEGLQHVIIMLRTVPSPFYTSRETNFPGLTNFIIAEKKFFILFFV